MRLSYILGKNYIMVKIKIGINFIGYNIKLRKYFNFNNFWVYVFVVKWNVDYKVCRIFCENYKVKYMFEVVLVK